MQLRPHHALAVPAAVAVVGYGALAVVGLLGWPGEVGSSGMVFCEASRDGIIKQPANAWSNLGFSFAGLWVGFVAWQHFAAGGDRAAGNRFRESPLYPTLYAAVATFVGPASMALHASTTIWGGMIDLVSMFLWAAFALAYGLARAFELDDARFLGTWIGVVVLVLGVYFGAVGHAGGTPLFALLLVLYALAEGWLFLRRPDLVARRGFLWGAAGLFAVALAIWVPSRTGGPLCDPHSLVQGHAIWHLLNAAAMVALFLFYDSERRRAAVA